MKVLYHVDSEAMWQMVLENVKNMLNYGKENDVDFDIEVVANGPAVMGALRKNAEDSGRYAEMDRLSKERVVFAACRNALKKFNTDNAPLCGFVSVVPSGVVELALKQEEGYSYIKP